ncbi:hypothetical protein [Pedobacter sp. UYP1]|jgi:hypothetical protein|uniref:hypothetical protein n=1 Tax=Pedobacter sp. UYP1 TaxID=1756396 RepID=UPI0033952580
MTKIVTSLSGHLRLLKKRTYQTAVLLLMSCIMGGFKVARAQDLNKKFTVINRIISLDRKSGVVHLNKAEGAGIAWINGQVFDKGVIEFDVKGKDEFQGSFLGIAFHGVNDSIYESVYFRPFNFRSTDLGRKSHAVQYIALPGYDWPKLRTGFPNQFEQLVLPAPDPNQWFHVKIIVAGELVSVYVNNSKRPALKVKSLTRTGGKMIGYWVGNGADGNWRNLKISSE